MIKTKGQSKFVKTSITVANSYFQAPVVQKLDRAIHRINLCQVDKY